jgi:cation:H+ antiporter
MLVVGAELLVRGGGRIAIALRVPVLVVALTIVATGTSTPEILVSIQAGIDGSPDIALANVTGSNIANIAFVLGAAAMLRPITVGRELMVREIPALMLIQLLVPVLLYDGALSRTDGLLLFLAGVFYNALLVRDALAGRRAAQADGLIVEGGSMLINGVLLAIGLVLLLIGADYFVTGAVELANYVGMDQRVIGLTVVAIGTSTPEILTALVAAWRGDSDMVMGNSLGSNIVNVSFALGITAMVQPVVIAGSGAWVDLAVEIVVSALLIPLVLRGGQLSRVEGAMLVGLYAIYTLTLVYG